MRAVAELKLQNEIVWLTFDDEQREHWQELQRVLDKLIGKRMLFGVEISRVH